MTSYTNVAYLQAKHGKSDALGDALVDVAEQSRLESGCLVFEIHESVEKAGLWFVYERWASKADLDKHFETPHLLAFAARLPVLLSEDMQLQGYRLKTRTSSQTA